ncbi:MAG: beta-N-acetylhexosaminidase [Lewinella sp.]|nr:beta-N-acetylhexosaminidase [Lewinella sp.]
MKRLTNLFFISALAVAGLAGCKSEPEPEPPATMQEADYGIVPAPAQLTPKGGRFTLNAQTRIVLQGQTTQLERVGAYLAGILRPATGFDLQVGSGEAPAENAVVFQTDESIANPEGYQLTVSPGLITIKAGRANGAFYAVQTLRQLLPPQAERDTLQSGVEWTIPAVEITDEPRFAYRGLHLDVGRHFFPVEAVKKYIDVMAMHKMNRFHWHLTEDQGWRIEIRQYPKLAEVAAWRKETLIGHYGDKPERYDGQRYGGYYTQDEVREVVRYAADRFIEIVPEIEMPGHALAALAAYPELSCTGGPFEVGTRWGVYEDVFCPKEETFTFLENVLSEVVDLFPGEYVHIGGDECPKTRWKASSFCQDLIKREGLKDEHELQSYFIRRIERFLNSKGKRIIGWDEILEGGLAPNATVMSWRGMEGGIAAAKQEHDVIMTPTTYVYLDYYQSKDEGEPLAIGGYLPLDSVYRFEPMPDVLTAEEAKHILGGQANVWTEYIDTPEKLEYMAFPRALAVAEVVWSPKAKRNYPDFVQRLKHHAPRLEAAGVNFARHALKD